MESIIKDILEDFKSEIKKEILIIDTRLNELNRTLNIMSKDVDNINTILQNIQNEHHRN